MDQAPKATLSTGLKIVNFSSAHAFEFDDGTKLQACSLDRCESLSAHVAEHLNEVCEGYTTIQLKTELSEICRLELARLQADPEIDLILVPLMIAEAAAEEGIRNKIVVVRMRSKITKVAFHNKFCVPRGC